jgi:predicted PhzF superfamily epimerase YddE/YHI9
MHTPKAHELAGPGRAPFFWIDAFTDVAFRGNPAGVCLLDGPADERWMQGLAGELGISETAFAWPAAPAAPAADGGERAGPYSLRWFTPRTEVDLCGHATLATAHAIAELGWCGDDPAVRSIAFETRSGVLTARCDGPLWELDLPADPPRALTDPVDWSALLPDGTTVVEEFRGASDLVAVVGGPDGVREAVPDLDALAALDYRALCITAPAPAGFGADYVLRVFGPRVGINEDPVTGSAQCLLGPHWSGRTGRRILGADQLSGRGGRLRVTVDHGRVGVAGAAVTVLTGVVSLPAPPVP